MLQQTRVDTVLPYYARWLRAFPTIRSLARAKTDRVIKLWEGLGYYSRARNLHRAAQVVVRDYNGELPRTAEGLHQLPGIGRYTAGAIASIAFAEQASLVDGNVARVFARIFAITENVKLPRTMETLWQLAEELLPAPTRAISTRLSWNWARWCARRRIHVVRRAPCAVSALHERAD